MKNSINYILSFILMCLSSFLIMFIVIQYSLNTTNILKILKKVDYYDLARENIISKIDEVVINHEVSDAYIDYFSNDLIKYDIVKILNKNDNISHYDNLIGIIDKYTNDNIVKEKYTKIIDSIYINNIFPIKEYNLIDNIKLDANKTLFISLVIIISIVFLSSLLFIKNRNLKYHKISLISTSMLLLLPFIFVNILNIFQNFIYTNKYYTSFIFGIISNITKNLFIIAIIILVLYFIFNIIKTKSLHLHKK